MEPESLPARAHEVAQTKRERLLTWYFRLAILAALCAGLYQGAKFWWVSDDAFIGYRYSKNFIEGRGLVFNEGERVEGFTDPLWVLWCSLPLIWGQAAETWGNGTGLVSYAASILLLAWIHRVWALEVVGPRRYSVPFAALAAGLHPDWAVFATSGLETSTFTAALVGAYACLVRSGGRQRVTASGALFALASLLRPDGALPGLLAGLWLLGRGRTERREALYFAGSFLALWAPAQAARIAYYGDLFPNTFYAKSGNLTYYSQGFAYVGTYLSVYAPLIAAVVLPLIVHLRALRPAVDDTPERFRSLPMVYLAAAIAAAYTLYVARVGGDFMFARMLIPATPFALLALDYALLQFSNRRAAAALALTGLCAGVPFWIAHKQDRIHYGHGIANERLFYLNAWPGEYMDRMGGVLKKYFEGLPVRMFMPSSQARMIYRSEVPYALESYGLTDAYIAHLPLRERARPGHEKPAPIEYILLERKVHFTTSESGYREFFGINRTIPYVQFQLDRIPVFVLTWDPPLMQALQERGVEVPDFLGDLDRIISKLDGLSDTEAADLYGRYTYFYFAHVSDPEREDAFKHRLNRGSPTLQPTP